jgi:chaperonin GroES
MSKTNIKPLDDRIVVKRAVADDKSAGGIILPDSSQDKPQRGIITAVGPGRLLDNGERAGLDVKVGDEVYFGKYGGTEIKVDDEDVIIMKESDVLAIVK